MTASFSLYLTHWNGNPYVQLQEMIHKKVVTAKTRIILAFASFNFIDASTIPDLGGLTMQQIQSITDLAHSVNAKISLSIGGIKCPFMGSTFYKRPSDLAQIINDSLIRHGFDGIDFNIEDNNVDKYFITNSAYLINTLRSLNNTLYITLTSITRDYSTYHHDLLQITIKSVSAWQIIECNLTIDSTFYESIELPEGLWIDPTTAYPSQIQYEINYYITVWGVPREKIIIGLMIGKDNKGNCLTLQNALYISTFAQIKQLQGVTLWNATSDSKGCDENAPYAYSMGVQRMFKSIS